MGLEGDSICLVLKQILLIETNRVTVRKVKISTTIMIKKRPVKRKIHQPNQQYANSTQTSLARGCRNIWL
jgi:hypothetical protein